MNHIGTKIELEKWIKDYEKMNTYEWGIELKTIKKIIGVIFVVKKDDKLVFQMTIFT